MAAFILALLLAVLTACFAVSGFVPQGLGINTGGALIMCASIPLSLLATVLGLLGLWEEDRRRTLAVWSLLLVAGWWLLAILTVRVVM